VGDGRLKGLTNSIFDSGTDAFDLISITVLWGTLRYDVTYYWRVRYQDDKSNWSEWSTATSFATLVSGKPNQPANVAPADGTFDIVLTPVLTCSAFSDPDAGDSHLASRWQITSTAGNYSPPLYDSGVSTSSLTRIDVSLETLTYGATYYWRVRHQDSYGNWSDWSAETSFTTLTPLPPNRPTNESPANGETDVSLAPSLTASAFSDPDAEDGHTASHWQITDTAGDYSDPVFDSGTDTSSLVKIGLPAGKLDYNTVYYWRVSYRDRYDMWSDWSWETSFTTLSSAPPRQPSNTAPVGSATKEASLTLTLEASAFSDPDTGDVHTASQWQITINPENYSGTVYDTGADTTNLTQIDIPSGVLDYETAYYWHVRYQDKHGNWSEYSEETSFTTTSEKASFSVTPAQAVPGQAVTFTDRSIGNITSWTWDFGDGSTMEWTTDTRPEDGKLTHRYLASGLYVVSLTVAGPDSEEKRTTEADVTVSEPVPADGGGGVSWLWIVLGMLVVLVALVVVWMRRR